MDRSDDQSLNQIFNIDILKKDNEPIAKMNNEIISGIDTHTDQNIKTSQTILTSSNHTDNNLKEIKCEGDRLNYLEENIDLSHCTSIEKKNLYKTFLTYSQAFQIPGDRFQHTTVSVHKIDLKPYTKPIYIRQFGIPEHHKVEMQKQLDELESKGIISKCDSPWNAPIFLVPKKDNDKGEKQYRMVVSLDQKIFLVAHQNAPPGFEK